jgi:hypothetical protein
VASPLRGEDMNDGLKRVATFLRRFAADEGAGLNSCEFSYVGLFRAALLVTVWLGSGEECGEDCAVDGGDRRGGKEIANAELDGAVALRRCRDEPVDDGDVVGEEQERDAG